LLPPGFHVESVGFLFHYGQGDVVSDREHTPPHCHLSETGGVCMSRSCKVTIIFLAVLFAVTYAVSSFAGKDGKEFPKLYIHNKQANVRDVYEGADIAYSFTVKNFGEGELHILSVRPG